MGPEGSLPYSQEPVAGLCPETNESSLQTVNIIFRMAFSSNLVDEEKIVLGCRRIGTSTKEWAPPSFYMESVFSQKKLS
jgi:hypothetical protein